MWSKLAPRRHALAADHPDHWFGDAFSIFLLRQFFLTIPQEYIDAARVDGCGEFRILTTVVLRLAKPAIAAVALFSFLYCFNDFFLPLLYIGESDPHNWPLSIGLSQFRNLHQVQWNLTMAATLLVMAPVIVDLLPRAEGLRRGRHPDGGEGMKIAVVGGGSTYTPELVSGLRASASARRRRARPPRHRRRAARGRRRPGRADARPPGVHGRAGAHRRPRPRARRRRLRAHPDPRRRPGRAARRRDGPARLRLHRPGDDRGGRLRQGAAHGAGRARDRRARAPSGRPPAPGSSTSPTRSGS